MKKALSILMYTNPPHTITVWFERRSYNNPTRTSLQRLYDVMKRCKWSASHPPSVSSFVGAHFHDVRIDRRLAKE